MATIKIDGREIPFEPGDTVIRAAHRAGIDIPHYCWHPGLSVAANCRMCLVEVPPPPGRPAMQLDILRWDAEKQDYVPDRKPKLQPACQMACAPGMEVLSESSNHVTEARSAVQELLLLNHPVDCPICDQAGECRLQDYWLEHQRTGKRMRQEVVHKPKAVVFGPTIVYDAERCIICTRCVRFSDEVAKDPVLDVRERGNLNEIIVSPGRQLDHDYTLMTEHVCPVGALTSIDFRFKARVWFLRSARTVCQGCSTGCNAFLDYDPRNNTPYRHRPRENMAVNTYWMCDNGMLSYKRALEGRMLTSLVGGDDASLPDALAAAQEQLAGVKESPARVAIVLSAQHSTEDNYALFLLGRTYIGAVDFFVSGRPLGKEDHLLMSADKNPNTRGVMKIFEAAAETSTGPSNPPRPIAQLLEGIAAGKYSYVIALGTDLEVDAANAQKTLSRLKGMVTIASHDGPLAKAAHVALPATVWAEAEGSYINKKGLVQRSERALMPRGDARPAWALIAELGRKLGYATGWKTLTEVRRAMPAGTWAGSTAPSHDVPAPATTTEESGAAV
ncbi:molybdopterin-dependent oxidoreductase [Chondromyces crocatus]|uniref:NADH dehydrogenase n=1 Tax=Chondromyces crocatus TaxID=52 RepID=A0A0K1ETA2_CHOCO|nr:molybdopterin-dependent oxidoreductase [Chondromyces crocatus]AKT43863.1 NADH dehydrogenase [Chondromyces crocatus]